MLWLVRDNKVPRWYELVEVEEVPEASNPIDPKGKVYTVTLDSKRIVTRNNKVILIFIYTLLIYFNAFIAKEFNRESGR